jgi:two-component system NtrC family sensor kinase
MDNKNNGKISRAVWTRFLADDYYELSHRILRCGVLGKPRGEFLRGISTLILDFSGCDALEFRVRDGDFSYLAEASRSGGTVFRFGAIDGYVGEDGVELPSRGVDTPREKLYRDILQRRFDPGQPYFTDHGTFWTGDAADATIFEFTADGESKGPGFKLGGEYGSQIIAPFGVGEADVGLLILRSRAKGYFTAQEADFYESVAQSVGVAVGDRGAYWRLRERVKEMTCLYGIAELASRPGISTEEVIRGIVELLPPAMQYPEITVGRIDVDGVAFATEDFEETPYKLSAGIIVNAERRGTVEVQYKEAKLDYEPGVFLREEQSLIDAVARQLGLILENRQAEEERARLQEQLRHADRLATIGQLAAGVAHELNEPLGNVLGFAQLIKKGPDLTEQVSRDVEKILTAALHARDVVKKLLIFARQMPTITSSVDLSAVTEEAYSFLASRLEKENIECVLALQTDMPRIMADPAQLRQVVVNLIVNAFQAMPGGGTLTLTTRGDDSHVYLIVGDTGVGMGEDVKKKIFLPFFTTKDVGQGTGLGLAVVHGIVASHGGSIDVRTEPGKGSKFEVRVPRKPPFETKED